MVEENKKLQKKIIELEEKVDITEVLSECTDQYGRRNNLEISGVPNNMEDSILESKLFEIFEKVDVKLKNDDFEACHRLLPARNNPEGNKKVIIQFVNKKYIELAFCKRKSLVDIEMSLINMDPNDKLYFGENLNRHFQFLS